jgi:FixJ family two-component response regulator
MALNIASDQVTHVHVAPTTEPTVFVIDDDVSVRESLEDLIRSEGWRPETFTSAEEFLACPPHTGPCCMVLDVSLPGLSGLELQGRLAALPAMPIIFVSGNGDVPTTVRAMKAGAVEFLTKPLRTQALLIAIREAIDRSRVTLGDIADLLALRTCYESLTQRQRQVMALIVAGLLNKQIAGELGLSEITVKAHRGRLMRKMNADSVAQLVLMAATLGPSPRRAIHAPSYLSRNGKLS